MRLTARVDALLLLDGRKLPEVRRQMGRDTAVINGDLGFRQHTEGHTANPTWATFLTFADRYFSTAKSVAR